MSNRSKGRFIIKSLSASLLWFSTSLSAWEWVSVPGSTCRDGSEAGYFIERAEDSNELLIFLEAGGACFNNQTCDLNANKIDPLKLPPNEGVFSSSSENPLASWNKVYVPYCTGDVMAGDNQAVYVSSKHRRENFTGFSNMTKFLGEWSEEFSYVDRVLLSGASSGGFGAIYNFDQVQQTFLGVKVNLLDDSGIPFSDSYLASCLQAKWRNLWGLDYTFPEDCVECRQTNGGGIIRYIEYLKRKYGGQQLGLLSFTEDFTIRLFYGFGLNSCRPLIPLMGSSKFRQGLLDVRQRYADQDLVTYFVRGSDHTFLTEKRLFSTRVGGVKLTDWIMDLIDEKATQVGP